MNSVSILHVTEAMGGGVESAIRDYALSTPNFTHELLYCRRGRFGTGDQEFKNFSRVVEVEGRVVSLSRALKKRLAQDPPAVLHLHSAWAGLVGRVQSYSTVQSMSTIYTPHSYYFDRQNIASSIAAVAYFVERHLAKRAVTAAVSPFERAQAEGLGAEAVYVPNAVRVGPNSHSRRRGDGTPTVVGSGRVSAQKDPEFFRQVKRTCDQENCMETVRWIWIGDGDRKEVQFLEQAGVRVTGWVSRTEAMATIASADAYVHTAAWEGSPISLLEVAALKTPVVARSIPALTSLGYPDHLATPHAVAKELQNIVTGNPTSSVHIDLERELQLQSQVLNALYSGQSRTPGK